MLSSRSDPIGNVHGMTGIVPPRNNQQRLGGDRGEWVMCVRGEGSDMF